MPSAEPRARSLLIAHGEPPSLGGDLVRLAQVVEALASVSDLDLFVFHGEFRSKIVVPPSVTVLRSVGVPFPRTSSQPRWRLDWVARRGLPLEVVMTRADQAPRLALREWARPPYDLAWISTSTAYEWTGRPDFGPTVVDLMDLEDVKTELRAELLAAQRRTAPWQSSGEPVWPCTRLYPRRRLAPIPAVGGGAGGVHRSSRATSMPPAPHCPTSS